MNIWIINQEAGKPSLGWGERHYNLAQEFVKKGHHVTIFSSSSSHLFFKNISGKLPKTEYVEGVKFCWIKTIQYNKSKSVKRILGWFDFIIKLLGRILLSKQNRPEKIIISSSPITPIVPAIILKKIYGAELIFEIRDIWPLSLQQLGGYSNKNLFIKFLAHMEKVAYRYSDKVVGVMKYGNQHVKNISNRNQMPYCWIPNGYKKITADEIIPSVKSMITELKTLSEERKIIGYIGTIGIANNMGEIIEIADYLKDYHFVLVGDGPEKENLLKKIDRLAIMNVSIYNKVPKEQLNHIIPFFDFGIISWRSLPIYEYGVSANKYFDYMFFGKPIIRLGRVKADPVELYNCGFSSSCDDAKNNAKNIHDFISNCDYNVLSANAKRYVSDFHSFPVLAEKYQKLFYV